MFNQAMPFFFMCLFLLLEDILLWRLRVGPWPLKGEANMSGSTKLEANSYYIGNEYWTAIITFKGGLIF